jgi:hypothetical protein
MELELVASIRCLSDKARRLIPVARRRRCFIYPLADLPSTAPTSVQSSFPFESLHFTQACILNTKAHPPPKHAVATTRYPLPHYLTTHYYSSTNLLLPSLTSISTLTYSPATLIILSLTTLSLSLSLNKSLPAWPSVPSLAASVNRSLAPPHCCEQLASATSLTRCRSRVCALQSTTKPSPPRGAAAFEPLSL